MRLTLYILHGKLILVNTYNNNSQIRLRISLPLIELFFKSEVTPTYISYFTMKKQRRYEDKKQLYIYIRK